MRPPDSMIGGYSQKGSQQRLLDLRIMACQELFPPIDQPGILEWAQIFSHSNLEAML